MVPRDRKDPTESPELLASYLSGENRNSYYDHLEPIISLLNSKLDNSFFIKKIMSPKGVEHFWHFYSLARRCKMSGLKQILKSCP